MFGDIRPGASKWSAILDLLIVSSVRSLDDLLSETRQPLQLAYSIFAFITTGAMQRMRFAFAIYAYVGTKLTDYTGRRTCSWLFARGYAMIGLKMGKGVFMKQTFLAKLQRSALYCLIGALLL